MATRESPTAAHDRLCDVARRWAAISPPMLLSVIADHIVMDLQAGTSYAARHYDAEQILNDLNIIRSMAENWILTYQARQTTA